MKNNAQLYKEAMITIIEPFNNQQGYMARTTNIVSLTNCLDTLIGNHKRTLAAIKDSDSPSPALIQEHTINQFALIKFNEVWFDMFRIECSISDKYGTASYEVFDDTSLHNKVFYKDSPNVPTSCTEGYKNLSDYVSTFKKVFGDKLEVLSKKVANDNQINNSTDLFNAAEQDPFYRGSTINKNELINTPVEVIEPDRHNQLNSYLIEDKVPKINNMLSDEKALRHNYRNTAELCNKTDWYGPYNVLPPASMELGSGVNTNIENAPTITRSISQEYGQQFERTFNQVRGAREEDESQGGPHTKRAKDNDQEPRDPGQGFGGGLGGSSSGPTSGPGDSGNTSFRLMEEFKIKLYPIFLGFISALLEGFELWLDRFF